MEHDAQPHQGYQHQLVKKEMGDHGKTPSSRWRNEGILPGFQAAGMSRRLEVHDPRSWCCGRSASVAFAALCATRSAKWRSRCPSANTRKPLRWRARSNTVWHWERKAFRTGDAIEVSCAGSLLIA